MDKSSRFLDIFILRLRGLIGSRLSFDFHFGIGVSFSLALAISLGFGCGSIGWSQVNVSPKPMKSEEVDFKKTILVDYHSWFENLAFVPPSGSRSGVKAIYYGFSASYDLTQYLTTWGWGTQFGLGQGYAVGDGDTNSYLQKRVSWNYLRGGGRIFKRLNGRTDLGLNLLVMYNKISWPQSDGTVSPGPNPFFSLFIEARWRMTRQWEMIQALGNSTNDAGASLRFGFGYTM